MQTTTDDIVAVLGRFCAMDTTSHRSNLGFLSDVEALLEGLNARVERFPNAEGDKATLFATIGPEHTAGYILSGHCDTVPVEGQAWSSPPFTLTRRNSSLFARGAVDMKGFLAVCVALAPEMARAPLKRPIHIAISYDEETGCVGVRGLLSELARRDPKPLGCFVGEPTSMDVVIGHKAKRACRASVRGSAVHSALAPQGVNAIEWAAALIGEIRGSARLMEAHGARDPLYDVPYSTGLTSMITGGVALNIVPDSCVFDFEFRTIACDDADQVMSEIKQFARNRLEPQMRQIDPRTGFTFIDTISYPALDLDPGEAIVSLAKVLSGRNGHTKVSFGTEAGLFQTLAGIPAIVVGPGSIERAHKADEFIEIAELEACARFVRGLITHCTH